ncbi:oxygen-independent coproporphyrinogen III oxidase [Corallincola holothuriorum]|uniref:Coproporphyrinogen-III oxidase n=1 Tax=Corallincola holothuriorum TaxID=2282215 RepID=A0A368N580_9GAMM|nr:oxygen-independent coproporphyrinogen III oxidase [Corallincola holothuriorum]
MTTPTPIWDQALIAKYNLTGPRYTSYPTALEFKEGFAADDLVKAIARSERSSLSLYVHIPFCHKLCYYCGCNKVITRHPHKADIYLDFLEREMATRGPQFQHYEVKQLHLGGGTPTFLSAEQMSRLMAMLRRHFVFSPSIEQGIEVDPREIPLSMMSHLAAEGFNRISIGVQDFNPVVQQAVNREQDNEFIHALVAEARTQGMSSVNLDLIYGLPHQTASSFAKTLEQTLAMDPDRLSVFNYAHLPERFAAQRKIDETAMPEPAEKMAMFRQSIEYLTAQGYQFIGMDHFAKPDDELAKLQRSGALHRNFQGYTTHGECDLLGLGVSSISQIGDCYVQNQRELKHYYQQLDERGDALHKGVSLHRDDLIRRDVIKALICNFELNFVDIEARWDIAFTEYFSTALTALMPLADDGLLAISEQKMVVKPPGRLLIRSICMCFDAYMQQQLRQRQFSRII